MSIETDLAVPRAYTMAVSTRRKPPGRPKVRIEERKSERLPPIYTTPAEERRYADAAARADKDWAEFGRAAFDFYIEHGGVAPEPAAEPAPQPENIITIEIPPDRYEKLTVLAETLGMEEVPRLVSNLARRAVKVKPKELKNFLFGSFFDGEEEIFEAARQKKKLRSTATQQQTSSQQETQRKIA